MQDLDETDVLVCLGDIGVMWPGYEKEGKYNLNWLNNQKYQSILIRGNHDNETWWESCPPTSGNDQISLLYGDLRVAKVGDTVYQNVFLVTSTAILKVCGKKCLCIGGAQSTDANYLAYPHQKSLMKWYKQHHIWYRVIGKSWWPNEGIDVNYVNSVLFSAGLPSPHWNLDRKANPCDGFDFIFSHQSPAGFCTSGYCSRYDRMDAIDEQKYLESIRRTFPFHRWLHGHMHEDCTWTQQGEDPVTCVYWDVVQLTE